jgi:hypothetical protein
MNEFLITNNKQSFLQFFKTDYFKYSAFAIVLFACKGWLITSYGNEVPFWDEWNGEAATLYKPFLERTLSWGELVANHGEHRIFTSRILHLGLFVISGYKWHPFLVMTVNACLHIFTLSLLIALLSRSIGHKSLVPLLLFSAVLFSQPYAYINTLMGFQSAFYFLIFFSITSLWMTVTSPPSSPGWWVGNACALLAFLSLASGIVALAASIAVTSLAYILGISRGNKQVIGIIIMLGLLITGFLLTPTIPGHNSLKAHSLMQFGQALQKILVWPTAHWLSFPGAFIYFPGIFFVFDMLKKKPSIDDPLWFILALFCWCVFQDILLAYGRAAKPVAHRYGDFFTIGLLVNYSCLLYFWTNSDGIQKSRYRVSIIAWLVTIGFGFYFSLGNISTALNHKKQQSTEQEKNVKAYLCTGDYTHLQNKPFRYIPYDKADELKVFLDDPTIRSFLPGNIYGPNSSYKRGMGDTSFCNEER